MAAGIVTPNKNDTRDTALTLYTGEVIKTFREKNVALGTVKSRTISGGKSAQFIVTGDAKLDDIQTHTRGDEVINSVLANDEVTITIEERFVHSHFLDTLDEKLAQYEVRGELAFQSGQILATKIDKQIFAYLGNTVAAMDPLPGQRDASTITATGYSGTPEAGVTVAEHKGNAIIAALYVAKAELNAKNVTDTPTVFVAPEDYYNIVQSTKGVNTDFTSNNGGIDTGMVRQIAGFSIGWTTHFFGGATPGTTTVTIGDEASATVLTDIKALMYTQDVMGVVKAMDIQSESNYDFRRLGYQLTSFYALGMGGLNPTGMVVINKP